jgi:hypothetical protein
MVNILTALLCLVREIFLQSTTLYLSNRETQGQGTATMLSLLSLALSALPLVAAQGQAVAGPFSPGNIKTSDAVQVYDNAARNSDSRLGTVLSPGFQFLLNNSIAFPGIWNWSTIVADIAIPVPEGDLGRPGADYSQGYHVINTQHRLNWTGYSNATEFDAIRGKSLQTVLRDVNVTLRLGFLPMHYVAGFTPRKRDPPTTDCADYIGLQCERSLSEAFRNSSTRFVQTGSLPGCNATIVDTSVTRLSK